jgi:hypothetical protein
MHQDRSTRIPFQLRLSNASAPGCTWGSSSSALAERMLSRRLLIWPPVLSATSSPPTSPSAEPGRLHKSGAVMAVIC